MTRRVFGDGRKLKLKVRTFVRTESYNALVLPFRYQPPAAHFIDTVTKTRGQGKAALDNGGQPGVNTPSLAIPAETQKASDVPPAADVDQEPPKLSAAQKLALKRKQDKEKKAAEAQALATAQVAAPAVKPSRRNQKSAVEDAAPTSEEGTQRLFIKIPAKPAEQKDTGTVVSPSSEQADEPANEATTPPPATPKQPASREASVPLNPAKATSPKPDAVTPKPESPPRATPKTCNSPEPSVPLNAAKPASPKEPAGSVPSDVSGHRAAVQDLPEEDGEHSVEGSEAGDIAPVGDDDDAGTGKFKPGPLKAEDDARFRARVLEFEEFIKDFATETGKLLPYLWDRSCMQLNVARKESLWNLYSHQWSLRNERNVDAGETPREYQQRCVAEYRAMTDTMSPGRKAAYKQELIDWAESYEKEVADDIVDKGELFKVMRRACEQFEAIGRPLYTHYNLVAFGFVICTDSTDAAGVASNACWANDDVVRKFLQERKVHVRNLGQDVCNLVGVKRLHTAEKKDWSMHAYLEWKALNRQDDRRDVFRDAFKHLQYVLMRELAPNSVEWVHFELRVFERKKRVIGWPAGVPLPSVARDKYWTEPMRKLMRAMYRMFDAMDNGTAWGSLDEPLLAFEDLSEDELELQSKIESRAEWHKVAIWKATDGTIFLRVEDFVGPNRGKKIRALRVEHKDAGKDNTAKVESDGSDGEGTSKRNKKARKVKEYVDSNDDLGSAAPPKGKRSVLRPPTKRKKADNSNSTSADSKGKGAPTADDSDAGPPTKRSKKKGATNGKKAAARRRDNPVGGGDNVDGGEDMDINTSGDEEELFLRAESEDIQHATPLLKSFSLAGAVEFGTAKHASNAQAIAPQFAPATVPVKAVDAAPSSSGISIPVQWDQRIDFARQAFLPAQSGVGGSVLPFAGVNPGAQQGFGGNGFAGTQPLGGMQQFGGASGVQQCDGVQPFVPGLAAGQQFPGGAQQFAGGAQQFQGGTQQFQGGMQQFSAGGQQFAGGGGGQQFAGGAQQFGVQQFAGGLQGFTAGNGGVEGQQAADSWNT